MDIYEVSEILGLCHFLKMPKHVFITQEPVSGNGAFYRGLQPKSKGDSIFLTGLADETTPIHEAIHADLRTDELATEIITRAILRKNTVIRKFPRLYQWRQQPPRYMKVEHDTEYPEAHLPKYRDRVEHYVLIKR